MIQAVEPADAVLPSAIVDAVRASVDQTYTAFFSEKPVLRPGAHQNHSGRCVAGIISFLGDVSWSLSWVLTEESAPVLARRFCGFDIPFDSSDMGDMAGELVNVIAGEIIAQLEQRSIRSQMSLPTIARGNPLELLPESGPGIVQLDYESKEGPFWLRVAVARSRPSRLPGK